MPLSDFAIEPAVFKNAKLLEQLIEMKIARQLHASAELALSPHPAPQTLEESAWR